MILMTLMIPQPIQRDYNDSKKKQNNMIVL